MVCDVAAVVVAVLAVIALAEVVVTACLTVTSKDAAD
jgi:hypothetical protein